MHNVWRGYCPENVVLIQFGERIIVKFTHFATRLRKYAHRRICNGIPSVRAHFATPLEKYVDCREAFCNVAKILYT